MRKIHAPDNTRMPVITKPHHSVKRFGLALTLCLASSLTNIALANNHVERTVKATGTLSAIVNKNYIDAGVSRNQIMVAILAANPHAFKGGNINYMLGGVDLRLPTADSIKNISQADANNLLKKHYSFFRRGKTGDLPAPTFITLTSSTQVDALVKEKKQQSQKLDTLQDERSKLSDLVKRLEDEKATRDTELQALEDRIQNLQASSNSLGDTTADLKLKLNNGELTGDGAKLLENLQDRNESLNAQLQSARSEMAESTRMEISLERRMGDIQEENSLMAEALKKQGLSPSEVLAKTNETNGNTAAVNTTDAASGSNTTDNSSALNSGIMGKINWIWLLPILGLLLLAGLFWKLLRKPKHQRQQKVKRSTAPTFVDYNQAIDPATEIEQEPPLEVSIKLDVARAYIEAGDHQAAHEMLNEVMDEGNTQQQLEAQEILGTIPE